MSIYILSFILNMIFGLSLCVTRKKIYKANELNTNLKKKKLYLIVTTVQLGLLCGFRSPQMGYDTGAYKQIFDMCPNNWEHIFDKTSYVEIGFRIYCSIIKILGGEFQTMLLITSLFVMGSCCVFIYRHSKDIVLSVFIIISFPFFYSSFDIIRHFIAISFLLLGYKYIEERKPIKFLVFIFLGSLFHSIVWVFVPFYYVKKIKWNWKTMSLAVVVTILLYIYIQPLSIWLSGLLGKSSGVASGWVGTFGGGIKTALMYGAIMLIAIVAYYQLKNKNEDDMLAVNYVLLMFICSVIFINARIMTRMIMTMVAFVAIAIPQLLDKKRTKSMRDHYILRGVFIIVGIFYHVFMLLTNWQNVVPYIPYWR